ncbi:fatty acid desaturase [Variibacter gotjawalensis]|uniref:Fatty acid desaturase n=1 Tax=Variibacter gotjawalensis TaxID=1333996 RepID=A0A0S3Q131_9BRAD|nr:fatty acid desaturase [Variibacter gotjawalensis]NIK47716.1 omega-6 fatty acid desaturase (delta-12 desaturase) [Variibacter gotjawalensis]RZS49610.1 omega-6 fatty acid desaturase (delta-12 desaturase) [Variibacter gotjawalensis]BAT61873.1 fatty acid desaturase [Variibacter gotjawalensis]
MSGYSSDALELSEALSIARKLSKYREPSHWRSSAEIVTTFVLFAVIWATMLVSLYAGYWIALVLALPAAGLLVRLFLIQHDCGHGSLFSSRTANDWVGRIIGVFTLTPYGFWRRAHGLHHASAGNLDRRGIGDIDTLTVAEYLSLSNGRRRRYRIYRHPLVMFGIGPAYLFLFRHRIPLGLMRAGWQPWASALATNVSIATLSALLIWLVGIGPFLLVQLPITLIAASIGVWLFYVQHQFEDTHWSRDGIWNFHHAGLHGSSHYDLPSVLRWFTANIGAHHVHHMCSKIPFYRLPEVLRDHPQLISTGRLTLLQSFRCVDKVLWDESSRKLISFREMQSISAIVRPR